MGKLDVCVLAGLKRVEIQGHPLRAEASLSC